MNNRTFLPVILYLLLPLLSYSCEKMDDVEDDKYNSELYSNKYSGKQFLNIVLTDTNYIFKVSDIEKLSTAENVDIDRNGCHFAELKLNTKGQSGIIVNDTVILFNNGANAIATSLITGECTSFVPECNSYHPHCNVANYYQKDGKHYVYLSEWDGKHRCFVEELYYNVNKKNWESRLVQILSLNIDDTVRGSGNMDWIIDSANEMIYTQTYKDGTSQNSTALVFLQFALPSPLYAENVSFTSDQIIRRIEYPMICATQDKMIYKNKLYIASGLGGNYPGKITVISLPDFWENEVYDLSYRNDEPEVMDVYKDNILLFYWHSNYSIQNKHSFFIYLKNGLVFSYPQSDIKEINYI